MQYKEAYFQLFNQVNTLIQEFQEAHRQAEELLISDPLSEEDQGEALPR